MPKLELRKERTSNAKSDVSGNFWLVWTTIAARTKEIANHAGLPPTISEA